MNLTKRHTTLLIGLALLVPFVAFLHLFSGQIDISFSDYYHSLFNFDESNSSHIIAREIRIPRMTMALIAGVGLSIAGLLMQTLFNNPLAGPYVLGINSGASLFVAFSVMSGIPFFMSDTGIILNALIGAFVFGLIILAFSNFVRNQLSLLLIGIMLGSFTGAFISIIQTVSNANELKVFTLWTLGSLQKVEFSQLPLIILVSSIGLLITLFIIKPLNMLILGESEAKLLGTNVKRVRLIIIIITALFSGLITAYCGPIAFVGLAVPNLVRILFKTQQHFILILACVFMGALFVLCCDMIIQLMENTVLIPINAITSIIGAPIVVVLVFRKLK